MNDLAYVWDFLEDLQENNAKEWMDEHRARYTRTRNLWLDQVKDVLNRLSKHDASFELFEPKSTIQRINNNRVFHPDKPIYKGYFSCSPQGKTDQISKVFFAVGPEFTMIGGGLYRPDNAALNSIRGAIDYDGDGLIQLLNEPKLQKLTGGLAHDDQMLKTSPKEYDNDHPHVELLRYKSFTAQYIPSKDEIITGNLTDKVEEVYLTIQPLVRWLEKALTV